MMGKKRIFNLISMNKFDKLYIKYMKVKKIIYNQNGNY